MTTAEQLYHELEALPDALKQEALNYIGYLKQQRGQSNQSLLVNGKATAEIKSSSSESKLNDISTLKGMIKTDIHLTVEEMNEAIESAVYEKELGV